MRSLLLLGLLVLGPALAQQATIELNDGTVVRGEITALSRGVYSVDSQSLGRIQIPQDRVSAIRYSASSFPSEPQGDVQLQDLSRMIAGDAQLMAQIQKLQTDPQIQQLINDPTLRQALASGNISALMANENFLKLLEHPQIRQMTRQVTGQVSGQVSPSQ